MTASVQTSAPISPDRLTEIAKEACDKSFGSAAEYDHTQTENWNRSIINNILTDIVSASKPTEASSQPPPKAYKYAVTSTIIQHLTPATSNSTASTGTSTDGASETTASAAEATNGDVGTAEMKPTSGRRGMHSATGAYWNNETDGMWTFKWDQGEKRGCDVVISVIWIQA